MVEALFLVLSLSLAAECTLDQAMGGLCTTASVDDSGVTLDGSVTTPGVDAEAEGDASVDVEGGGTDPNTFCVPRLGDLTCWSVTPPPGDEGAAAVTLADIAHFHPEVGAHVMEPGGWVVAGLPANVYSDASVHSVEGSLLGSPATVRFTPVSWLWDYGDSTTAALATGGAPWRDLDAREFDATATSHRYDRRGTYTVTLTIEFRAEYRVGGGAWTAIDGTVPLAAAPITVTATRATTVLVDRDCRHRRFSIGCE